MRPTLRRLLLVVVILGALSACTQPGAVPSLATTAPQPTTSDSGPTEPAATTVPAATSAPAATTAPTATTEPTAPAATIAPTATPDPAANAPKDQAAVDLLLEASKAQLAQKAFRATITGKDQTTVIEYVNPDSYHLVTPGSEIIIVKDGTFIKEGSGQWQKSPVNMQGLMTEIMSEQGIERLVENLKYEDIELVGADLIGGRPMWVYQYKSTVDAAGTQVAAESKNWIGVLGQAPLPS